MGRHYETTTATDVSSGEPIMTCLTNSETAEGAANAALDKALPARARLPVRSIQGAIGGLWGRWGGRQGAYLIHQYIV